MVKGTLTFSIDLELGWGNWNDLEAHHVQHITRSERLIVRRLLEIFDRYELPATWAFVAALLDRESARERPGDESLWFAPDVIDAIRSAKVDHELGSHGGHHQYFDELTAREAGNELAFAKAIHAEHGLPFTSFVFPRNKIAKLSLLKESGIGVYRGEDIAWHQSIRNRNAPAGRAANLIDKMLPITPRSVRPEASNGLINLPGSMLFLGREGIRRFVSSKVVETKLRKGLDEAQRTRSAFHLWFHPSNFWHETDRQFAIFEKFASLAAERVGRGDLEVKPMAAYV